MRYIEAAYRQFKKKANNNFLIEEMNPKAEAEIGSNKSATRKLNLTIKTEKPNASAKGRTVERTIKELSQKLHKTESKRENL
jgi:hypothetical protein